MSEYEEVRKILAERMSGLMKEKGVTEEEFSKATNIPLSKLQKYIKGEGNMMTDEFIKICIALDVSADYLLGNNPYAFPFPNSEKEIDLYDTLGKLEKEDAMAYLKKMIDEQGENGNE